MDDSDNSNKQVSTMAAGKPFKIKGCLGNVVATIIFGMMMMWVVRSIEWNNWVTNVSLACEKGNTIADVEYLLGTDYQRVSSRYMLSHCQQCEDTAKTDSIIKFFQINWSRLDMRIWDAYIYIDAQGKVSGGQLHMQRD